MKIAIIGYSGSGKSTLAEKLGKHYSLPVLHLDCVHWLPGWVERDRESELSAVGGFLEENADWVIDGNYSRTHYERRMAEADAIIFMDFNRFTCLSRAIKRLKTYKGKTRASITEGCDEKIDFEFFSWLVWKGRTKKRRRKFTDILEKYPEKTVVIKNQRELTAFEEKGFTLPRDGSTSA